MANQNNDGYTPVTTSVRFFTEATENGNRPSPTPPAILPGSS